MKLAAEISLLLPNTAVMWVPGIPFGGSGAASALSNDGDAFLRRHSFSLGAAGGNPAVTQALWYNSENTAVEEKSSHQNIHSPP